MKQTSILNVANKKYFLYVRKSSEDSSKQIASIPSQIEELRKLADRSGYEIVDVFQESKSAKAPGVRTEFYKMLARIEKDDARGILCWKLDRLARNPVDGGRINWMLQNGIIQHIKTSDREYLPGDNTLMATLEFGMANQFIIDLRSNTLRGLRGKAEKGIFPSHAPLGYINEIIGKQGENRIFVDEKRFPIIRKLWDLLLSGKYSVGEITFIAQNEYHLTGMKGFPISDGVLYKMFGNIFYYGDFLWQEKVWKGTHVPMITKEEFEKAQQIINRKKPSETNRDRFAYTRIMRCGECGCSITAELKKKTLKNGDVNEHIYYRCSRQKGPGSCSQLPLKMPYVDAKIESVVEGLEIPGALSEWIFEVLREEFAEERGLQRQAKENLVKAYDRYENQLKNLFDMRMNGEIDSEGFEAKKTEVTGLRDHAKKQLEGADSHLDAWLDNSENDFRWAEGAITIFRNNDGKDLLAKREIVTRIIKDIVVQDREVQIELSPIFDLVLRLHKMTKNNKTALEPTNTLTPYGRKSDFGKLSVVVGAVVEEVRTVFEKKNDATIYIPTFYPTPTDTISPCFFD